MTLSWRKPDANIILASQSARRKDILQTMGLSFSIIPPDSVDERAMLDPARVEHSVRELAIAKAQSIAAAHPDALVLGADTIVVIDTAIIGKPENRDDAIAMLRTLAGRRHVVYTGVALVCRRRGFLDAATARTAVHFRNISDDEIMEYISGGNEYADKAGAYAIQGGAMTFVDKIEGCFYNVMGLPITETIALFQSFVSERKR